MLLLLYPVFDRFSRQAFSISRRSSFIFFKLSSVANSSQVASGLPVGCNIDAITNFPFTLGNHLAKLIESLIFSGNKITSAVTPFFEVDGLQANCIPYNDCTRGETISICEMPRSHRSEEHTSELQSRGHIVCRLLLETKKPHS